MRDPLGHLLRYPFPGNVRALDNLLHQTAALISGLDVGPLRTGV